MDVPVWQRIYEEINDPDFVLICVAEDTGGEAAAGPIFDAAAPTYVQGIDENHLISSLFNFVNVPSAVWIDEEGRIVRYGHTGEEDGVSCRLYSYPEQKIDLVILGNMSWCSNDLGWSIHDLLDGRI